MALGSCDELLHLGCYHDRFLWEGNPCIYGAQDVALDVVIASGRQATRNFHQGAVIKNMGDDGAVLGNSNGNLQLFLRLLLGFPLGDQRVSNEAILSQLQNVWVTGKQNFIITGRRAAVKRTLPVPRPTVPVAVGTALTMSGCRACSKSCTSHGQTAVTAST